MRNVINTLDILVAVSERQPIGVGELARMLELPKSTVQRSLLTLERSGWIRAVDGEYKKWMLTTKSLVVGTRATAVGGIRDAALPVMHRMRALANETTNLSLFEGNFAVLVERLDSTHPVRTFAPLGVQAPLHASAAGRAILSQLPRDVLTKLLSKPLSRHTPHTLTKRDQVLAEVDATRERGYGMAISEWNMGVAAVGAAIVVDSVALLGRPGGVVGAVAISGPEHRMPPERLHEFGPLVAASAAAIADVIAGGRSAYSERTQSPVLHSAPVNPPHHKNQGGAAR